MKLYHWIKNMIRRPIVNHRIKSGRYMSVYGGENAYFDVKNNYVMVKGYYDKPFSYTTPIEDFNK